MKKKRILMLLGSVVLALMLVVPLIVACAAPTPTPAPTTPAPTTPAPTPSPPPSAEVFNWRFTSWSSPGSYYGDEAYPDFCQKIEDMSGGRITVEYISAAALAGEFGAFDSIRQGIIEIGAPWVGGYDTILDEAKCEYGVPFGLRDSREVLTLYYERGWEELLREAYMDLSPPVYYLSPDIWCPLYLTVNKPVTTLDELRELKIRAVGGCADYLGRLGVTTVVVAWEELYTGVATGTIDGILGPGLSEFYDLKTYEFAKYIVQPSFIGAVMGADYMVNMDAWNSLPEDLQEIVYGAAQEASSRAGVVGWTDYELQGTVKMLEEGASYVQLEDAALPVMAEAAKEQWADIAAISPRTAEMMAIYEQYMKELGYID
ncbi:Lactate-binding periplasmic protein [subsurface metagenome]